jgi:putative intracellular protease/amidase
VPKILVVMTKAKTLGLLDDVDHPSGFWAEEFVTPHDRFVKEGYDVDIAHYKDVIGTLDALRAPMDAADVTDKKLSEYAGVYVAGGHGAMEDMSHACDHQPGPAHPGQRHGPRHRMPRAVVPAAAARRQRRLAGYRMTSFSREEELATDMAGQLPFVLQIELQRLGAKYEKAGRHLGVARGDRPQPHYRPEPVLFHGYRRDPDHEARKTRPSTSCGSAGTRPKGTSKDSAVARSSRFSSNS